MRQRKSKHLFRVLLTTHPTEENWAELADNTTFFAAGIEGTGSNHLIGFLAGSTGNFCTHPTDVTKLY